MRAGEPPRAGGMMDPFPRSGAGMGLGGGGGIGGGGGGGGGGAIMDLPRPSGLALPGDIDNPAPPTMACPICGRDNFKTQTELEVHSAQCMPAD